LGLLSLGTVLNQNGIDVKIIDANNHFYNKQFNQELFKKYIEENILSYIGKYKPSIIGIGCTFLGVFVNLKVIAGAIGKSYPDVPVVLGGSHPTIFPKEILSKFGFIDYVIVGEGEHTFLQLIKSLLGNSQDFRSIDGIAFRENGGIRLNPKTSFISNLDRLPLVDYGLLDDVGEYNMDTSKWYSPKGIRIGQPFPILSSRSCPNRCTFCNMRLMHGDRFRPRTAYHVLEEMEKLYNNYGVRYFQFMDDNVTFDKQRILDICRGILDRDEHTV